ncbi:hypothetical protein E7T06_08975 [Deinococcus sp. Arct2-2]|uniref:hypothetical protein n=1 Tax=Deinococcus sp. Arct2-2 TaxID=2568653 RepID=UPI0010A489F5|nr:hypothetical protein [Deinococcus sp. Arct2-2]THF70029.1 hypothetical protein E7T06_08975 [Deinococcus sp. Arct2-2]
MFPNIFSLLHMALALGGTAQAGCEIARTAFDLTGYTALQAQQGSFQVDVRCDAVTDRFQLELLGTEGFGGGGMATVAQPGEALAVRLNALESGGQLLIWLQGAGALLNGEVMEGSQRLRFPLAVPAGQWTGGGTYRANLRLSLLAVGTLSTADIFSGVKP